MIFRGYYASGVSSAGGPGRAAFVLFLAIVATLAGLAHSVREDGLAIATNVEKLVRVDLASVKRIDGLREDFSIQTLALHRLLLTADADALAAELHAVQSRIRVGLDAMYADCAACPDVTALLVGQGKLEHLASSLQAVMLDPSADRERAMGYLRAADAEARASELLLELIARQTHARVEDSRGTVEAATRQATRTVSMLAFLIAFVTILLGCYIWHNVLEARARRRLALFPERNPQPVFSLSPNGVVTYANPAAHRLAMTLFGGGSSPSQLLPGDLQSRLTQMCRARIDHCDWEYEVGSTVLCCTIYAMADPRTCHAYVRDITAQRRAEDQLSHLANHDPVTGLPNQRAFNAKLDQLLAESGHGAVMLLQLDRFHGLVETLGHIAGEQLLTAVGLRLAGLADDEERIYCVHRLEAEVFGIVLTNIVRTEELVASSRRIADAMRAPLVLEGRELFFNFSLGSCTFPEHGNDRTTLLRHADTALQQVIRSGGNRLLVYGPEMDHRTMERLEIEHSLRHVEKRGELELHYQPQVNIASRRIVGVEALVRWRHPERGLIPPAEFIPLAEETGMIIPIGEWVLETACAQCKDWQMSGLPPLIMAVNISPRQFLDPDLPALVRRTLARSGLDPAWLELEVTEGAAMHDLERGEAMLRAFKEIGVHLSIDDFGTGHSSLAYLSRFPIDKLKLDQSFVRNLTRDESDAAIARTVVALGHSLELTVIAEGVENSGQLERLREFGCDEIQGFLLSQPLPEHLIRSLLASPPTPTWMRSSPILESECS